MALYRGMDIGTAKPTAEERRAVPHHLIDILEPSRGIQRRPISRGRRQQPPNEIRRAGSQVLFVGGTALYLKALLRGLFSGPPADWKLRRELEEIARVEGPASRCTPAWQKSIPRPPRSCIPTTFGASSVPWKSTKPPASRSAACNNNSTRSIGRTSVDVFVLDWPREAIGRADPPARRSDVRRRAGGRSAAAL